MTLDREVDRAWRRFATLLAGALLFVACTFLVVTLYFRAEVTNLQTQVSAGDQSAECRTGIANAATVLESNRNTAQSEFVIATQRRGEARAAGDQAGEKVQFDAASRAVSEVERLNRLIEPATEIRARSVEICAANPDFTPPN